MSLHLEGKSCPVCHAYLFDEDDVVFCPICGAPHHRDCYQAVGHCALEELHGTDRQYDLVNAPKEPTPKEEIKVAYHTERPAEKENDDHVTCGMCGESYDRSERACPNCGTMNITHLGPGYTGFDFLGGVPADMDLGDGVTADEAKRFVASNTHRFIPKFAAMANGIKASWNWLAFFLPSAWFFSRKMYKTGFLTAMLSVAFSLFSVPLQLDMYRVDVSAIADTAERSNALMQQALQSKPIVLIAAIAGLVLSFAFRVLMGIFADLFYRNHTIETVKKLKDQEDAYLLEDLFRRKGGVSLWGLLLGLALTQYLPQFLLMLL